MPERERALVAGDIEALRAHGVHAPISMKAIKGANNHGLYEIRTRGFRTFYCVRSGVIWVLHICKKEHQSRGIGAARARMEAL